MFFINSNKKFYIQNYFIKCILVGIILDFGYYLVFDLHVITMILIFTFSFFGLYFFGFFDAKAKMKGIIKKAINNTFNE